MFIGLILLIICIIIISFSLYYLSRGLSPDSVWFKLGITRFEFYKFIYNKTLTYPIFIKLLTQWSRKKIKIVTTNKEATYFGKLFRRPFGVQISLRPILKTLFHENDYDQWKHTRKMLVKNVFAPAQVELLSDTIRDCALECLSKSEQLVDAVSLARRYVDKIFYRCVFNGEASNEKDFSIMSAQLRHQESKLLKQRKGVDIVSKAESYFTDLIGSHNQDSNTLLSAMKRVFTPADSVIESNSVSFILGGYTASVSTLVFAMYELSEHIKIQEEVRKELLNSQASITLNCVVKETLRKYPPFAAVLKESEDSCTTWVLPISGIHHDEQLYSNPTKFYPQRFFSKIPQMYCPFGIGIRRCPGEYFAYTIIKLFLKQVLLSYYLKPPSNGGGRILKFSTNKFTTSIDRLELFFENSDLKI